MPASVGAVTRPAKSAGAAAGRAPAPVRVPDEVIVRYSADADRSRRAALRESVEADVVSNLPLPGGQLVRLTGEMGVDAAMARLRRSRDVLYAEPNVLRTSSLTMNDPFFDQLWGLRNSGQILQGTSGTPGADVSVPSAWDLTTGSPSVTVAVVDSGVATGHPDLRGQIATNPGEIAGNGIDDDANGYADDVAGWDFVERDPVPEDANGHGTHVAGTVAARGNDGIGVVGVAPATRIMPLRVLDANGSGTLADVLSAYGYAARNGARVVNLSLGGGSASRAERDAISAAPGVLFVAAAGNGGSDGIGDDNDVAGEYPCSYDLANVVCVAASDRNDGLASFSNYGAAAVDLAAPGTTILSDLPPSSTGTARYGFSSGTSMATPHVSAASALGLAFDPSAGLATVKQALIAGADARSALTGRMVSGGRLNARRMLQLLSQAPTDAPAGSAPSPVPPSKDPSPPPAAPAPITTIIAPQPQPQPPPQPTRGAPPELPDTAAPLAALLSSERQRISTLRRRGLRPRARCLEPCIATAVLSLSPRIARRTRLGARRITIARARARMVAAASAELPLRLTRSGRLALSRLDRLNRPVRATLAATFADAAGNRRTLRKSITLIARPARRR